MKLSAILGISPSPLENLFSRKGLTIQLPDGRKESYLSSFKYQSLELMGLGYGPLFFMGDSGVGTTGLDQARYWEDGFKESVPQDTDFHSPFILRRPGEVILPKSTVIYTNMLLNADPTDPIQMEYITYLARVLTVNAITVTSQIQASLQDYNQRTNYTLLAIRGFRIQQDFATAEVKLQRLIDRTTKVSL